MNLADEIALGFSAVERGFIDQRKLGEAIGKWLEQASERGLGDYLVELSLLNPAQVQDLSEKYQTINLDATADHDQFATQQYNSDTDSDQQSKLALRGEQSRFKIIKQFAKGGLGVVYLAHDRQLQRDVALKQIRGDCERDALSTSKFVLEAEITGQLEHPGIVPVYALGLDPNGNPFYAMRFIRGKEFRKIIQQFHEARRNAKAPLDGVEFRQMLRRFLDVCYAIDYAHSRGILHRDLKPANIMIGSYGETLVVDWGLAKLLPSHGAADRAENDLKEDYTPQPIRLSGGSSETLQGNFSGTVAYASPEQLTGSIEKLCPASDVFSLGAVLFELLTNKLTLSKKPSSITQVVEWTRDPDFANCRSIDAEIPRSLAMICKKAMAYEIVDRYGTARDLACDVERWLADERVLAFGPREPLVEKVGRLMRRYRRWTVPVLATVLFSTIVALIGAWLINNARIQEMLAKRTAIQNKNEAINRIAVARSAIDTLLVGSTESLGDFPAARDLQKRLLEVAAADYAKLGASKSEDPELELERLRALVRVADIQMLQNAVDEATQNYKAAIAELQSQVTEGKFSPAMGLLWEVELAKTIGRFAFAISGIEGKSEESKSQFASALTSLRALAGANPQSSDTQLALGRTLIRAAESNFTASNPTASLDMIDEALKALQHVDVDDEQVLAYLQIQANQIRGKELSELNRYQEAIQAIDESLMRIARFTETHKADRKWFNAQADSQEFRAAINRKLGKHELALQDSLAALDTYQQLKQEWPDSLDYSERVALASTNAGLLLLDQNSPFEAIPYFSSARRDYSELRSDYPRILRYGDGLGSALSGLGQAEMRTNESAAVSIALLKESEEIYRSLATQQSESGPIVLEEFVAKLASVQGQLGQALQRGEDETAASQWYETSATLFKNLIESGRLNSAYAYGLAEVEWRRGQLDWEKNQVAAQQFIASSLDRLRELVQQHPANDQFHIRLAEVLLSNQEGSLSDFQEADEHVRIAVESQPDNLAFLNLRAELQVRLNKLAAAKELLDKILSLRRRAAARDLGVQALYDCQVGDRAAAIQNLAKCRELASSQQPYDPDLDRWMRSIQTSIDALP